MSPRTPPPTPTINNQFWRGISLVLKSQATTVLSMALYLCCTQVDKVALSSHWEKKRSDSYKFVVQCSENEIILLNELPTATEKQQSQVTCLPAQLFITKSQISKNTWCAKTSPVGLFVKLALSGTLCGHLKAGNSTCSLIIILFSQCFFSCVCLCVCVRECVILSM